MELKTKEDITNKIFNGDSLEVLKTFPSNSIDLVVTSPPYYNLRNYKHDKQIGMELTPKEYVTNLINIFRECKRVIKDTGSIWLNIADSYNKHKSLIGIPERLSIAMQDELNFYRRNTIIWHKPSCMPSSAKDRFTIDFEYFYWFFKHPSYYFETQYEPMTTESILREGRARSPEAKYIKDNPTNNQGIHYARPNINQALVYNGTAQKDYKGNGVQDPSVTKKRILEAIKSRQARFGGNKYNDPDNLFKADGTNYKGNVWIPNDNLERIKRTVWSLNTPNTTEDHFATYPESLIETPIKACTKEGDLILDPFLGSGTTAIKAQKLKRSYVGIELNPKYVSIAKRRLNSMITSYIKRN